MYEVQNGKTQSQKRKLYFHSKTVNRMLLNWDKVPVPSSHSKCVSLSLFTKEKPAHKML